MFVTYSHSLPFATCDAQDVWRKCRRYSRIVGQTLLFALTAIFFAGQVLKDFPKNITNNTLVLLSGVGLIALPYTLDLIKKTGIDALLSVRTEQYLLALLAVVHVAEMVSNTGLLVFGLGAAWAGLNGKIDLQSSIYNMMIPWGETTIVVGVLITMAYFAINYAILKKIDRTRSVAIAKSLMELTKINETTPDAQSAVDMRFCMDKDTLEKFLQDLEKIDGSEEMQQLMEIAINNIDTQVKVALGGQLGLTLLGYILLAIEKYYTPNSIQTASINLGMSIAYTAKTYVETIREIYQRHQMSAFTKSIYEL